METEGIASVPVGTNCAPLPTESPQPINTPQTNQTVQTERGDVLNQEPRLSGGSEEAKTADESFVTPELVQEWKKFYLREGHSVASTKTYFNYIKSFVDYGVFVNQKTVDRWRVKSTAGAAAGALKNFFNFLVKKKEFSQEILYIHFDKSKSQKKFPEAFETIEVEKIIEAIPGLKEKYFTIVMANLGLRIGECMKLKWEDFSWATWLQDRTKQASVNLKNTKGGKFRTIPVSPEIMEILYQDNVNPNKSSQGIPIGNLIFDFGIMNYLGNKEQSTEENIYDYLKYAGDRYRLALDKVTKETLNKKSHPHMFRHYRAQSLLNKGLPLVHLKNYLGHASISSTEIYAKSSAEQLKKELEKIEGNEVNN
jgi:integrase